jgi:hypothetical protein
MIKPFLTLAIGFELAAGLAVGAEPSAPAPLQDLLARAGQQVARFWDRFSAVTCIETIDQEKLSEDGKVLVKKHSSYDYLVLLQFSGDDLMVDESRVLQGKPAKESDRALLSTSGFSTLVLIFHPRFHGSYVFTDEGKDPQTPLLQRVRFQHVRGQRSPSVLQLRSREYPIEWQGTAWLEFSTGNITRIQAGLQEPLVDVGLRNLESEVQYSPVSLRGQQELPWMPMTARIEAGTQHQHWRNLHQFTAYKEFSVSTDARTEAPKEVSKP